MNLSSIAKNLYIKEETRHLYSEKDAEHMVLTSWLWHDYMVLALLSRIEGRD